MGLPLGKPEQDCAMQQNRSGSNQIACVHIHHFSQMEAPLPVSATDSSLKRHGLQPLLSPDFTSVPTPARIGHGDLLHTTDEPP